MLRITVQKKTRQTHLILEGRLAGAWVEELNRVLHTLSAASKMDRVTINLSAVSGMDDAGRILLSECHARGVKLAGKGLAARAVVEEIAGENGGTANNPDVREYELPL